MLYTHIELFNSIKYLTYFPQACFALQCYVSKTSSNGIVYDADAKFTIKVLRERFARPQTVCSYGNLDRYAFVGFVAALGTYLVVLIQFKQAM